MNLDKTDMANTNPPPPQADDAPSDEAARLAAAAAKPSARSTGSATSEQIRQTRRLRWEWNGRLVVVTIVVTLILSLLATGSYLYNSRRTASTFLQRAEQAADAENYSEQAKWLRRYSLLKPDDLDAIVNAAIAADEAADRTALPQRSAAINNARKQLSNAIGRLSAEEDHARETDLRIRLIERLLQLGSYWCREAERQVVLLDAEPDDPRATKWLAQALTGQVNADAYTQRQMPLVDQQETDYWNWLAGQPVGAVLALAVERNEKDLDLLASFLNLLKTHPEHCQSGDNLAELAQSLEETKQELASAVAKIRDNQDGRSQLLVYELDIFLGREHDARAGLLDAAQHATNRLASLDSQVPGDQVSAKALDQFPESTWDYFLVLEAAKVAALPDSDADRVQAAMWLEQLTSLQLEAVPPAAAENAFLTAGTLQEQLGHTDQAIEIWERGLKQVNANSLQLLWRLSSVYAQRESDPQAAEAVKRFEQAIDVVKTHWLRTTADEASRAERVALGRELDVAAWRLSVLKAIMNIHQGQQTAAISGLTRALSSSTDLAVDPNERIRIATALAELCKAEGLWDQAAEAYDRAVEISPGDLALRAASANAWTRSGNRLQAMEQWRIAGNSDSWILQLQSANALFEYQLRLPVNQRDFSGTRAAIDRLQRKLPTPAEISDENVRREVTFARTRLQVLELSVPPPGVSAEEHMRSATMADRVAELAAEHPDNETIQAFAAERLAAAGKVGLSQQALARVKTIVGPSATLTILQARLAAQQDGPLAASQILLKQAEQDDARTGEVLRLAAAYAMKANDAELAYQALNQIPEDQWTVTMLYTIANVAMSLPSNSDLLSDAGKRLTPSELSLRWEQQLKQREGDSGAYWRYLKATRLINRLYGESKTFADDDPAIEQARILVRDILSLRPRWGEAISLEGWLSALKGQPEKAVQQLRRGIAAGDARLQTRQRLMEQLYLLERYAEVEQEISAAAMSTEVAIDKYAATRIGLMQLQGDYDRSLAVAESAVEQRPEDFVSHLVLAITASQAATKATDKPNREKLISRAHAAIDRADELADENESRIFAARLQIEMAHGDEQSVRAEIAKIKASDLDPFLKLALESRALILLKDYEAALPLLKQADQQKPSQRTRFALAELYRQMQRHNDEVKLLRKAHAKQPDNEGVRNDLARALVARDGKDVDWDELANLLSSAQGVTANNRFLYAMLLGSRGTVQQQTEAAGILRELIEEQNQSSDDARRFLAALLRKRLDALSPEPKAADADAESPWDKTFAEIQSLFEELTLRSAPALVDLYRYADLLLELDEPERLSPVGSLLDSLKKHFPGTLPALDVDLRYAIANDNRDSVPERVRNWNAAALKSDTMDEANAATVAGSTLLNLGFFDTAVPWLERAYRDNVAVLPNYIRALNRTGQSEKSVGICITHFEQHQDATSATLLVESVLNVGPDSFTPQVQMLILQAMERFGEHAPLLEGVATLNLQQNDLKGAIPLYEKAHKLAPDRVRTLNNLAMAYSEMPGQASKGIKLIDRAIKLQGDDPELFDTKGVVLLKANKPAQAQAAFQSALDQSAQPHYQFHLIVALLAQKQDKLAQEQWQKLDLNKLDPVRLTQAEREQLKSMKSRFGEHPTVAEKTPEAPQ
ncbi:tetratricopeptide repeat protein [Roseimaritima ulvae]|uniref:tetratricopeptide repeat protein n=1 Tax=Roseimaritima ulvae TaxID=980254 RepID=UPI0011CE24E6|nr:tetratricopeptide repeat protein [Roseimaritima ulvae]